jgi:hypothetical protein
MLAVRLFLFQSPVMSDRRVSPVPEKRAAPVFIGDAIQPFGGETLLLALLRRDADPGGTEQG